MQTRSGGNIDYGLGHVPSRRIHPMRRQCSRHAEWHVVVDLHDDIELVFIHFMDCTVVTEAFQEVSTLTHGKTNTDDHRPALLMRQLILPHLRSTLSTKRGGNSSSSTFPGKLSASPLNPRISRTTSSDFSLAKSLIAILAPF